MIRSFSKLVPGTKAGASILASKNVPKFAGIATSAINNCDAAAAQEEDPEFLEMVQMYAENAYHKTLDRLMKAPPAPGKRHEPEEVRQKNIKGINSLATHVFTVLVIKYS